MTSINATEPVAPSEADAILARESARRLASTLAKANGTVQLKVMEPGAGNETVAVPTAAFRLLVVILAEMARGNAVRLIPHHAELTTQEAAEILNVSRPYLVRLLEEGRLPFHRTGTHRRVFFKDVMAFKAERHGARSKVLDELSKMDQDLGLT
jgi:excisionase family DNA binding protein